MVQYLGHVGLGLGRTFMDGYVNNITNVFNDFMKSFFAERYCNVSQITHNYFLYSDIVIYPDYTQ
jgi:hypothetical protein